MGGVNEGWTDIPPFLPFWKHDLVFALTGAAWNQPFPTPLAGSLVSISHTLCPGKARCPQRRWFNFEPARPTCLLKGPFMLISKNPQL